MMKKIVLLSLLMIPAMLLATGHTDGEVTRYFTQTGRADDFWPRVVNFTLFAIIIIYLVANPIKSFFKGRSQAIAKQLSEIEEKLKMAKEAQKEAQNRLDESEKRAEVILTDAKAEAILLAKKNRHHQ
jgi:F-type H+-transporting ATPase subunit b